MIDTFENWYKTLTDTQQKQLLDHIFNKQIKSLNEGFFSGPIGKLEKGLFTGPISSQRICPTCSRPM